jgi:hypothetical protein
VLVGRALRIKIMLLSKVTAEKAQIIEIFMSLGWSRIEPPR